MKNSSSKKLILTGMFLLVSIITIAAPPTPPAPAAPMANPIDSNILVLIFISLVYAIYKFRLINKKASI